MDSEAVEKRRAFYAARKSYLEAKASKAKTYLGSECRHPGHGREKYVVSRNCVACAKFYSLNDQRPAHKQDPAFVSRRRRGAPLTPTPPLVLDSGDEQAWLLALLASGA